MFSISLCSTSMFTYLHVRYSFTSKTIYIVKSALKSRAMRQPQLLIHVGGVFSCDSITLCMYGMFGLFPSAPLCVDASDFPFRCVTS